MKKFEFNAIAAETLKQLVDTLEKKGNEYSTGDVFSNFKDASRGLSFHSKPEMVAWEFCVKHLQSIKDIISGKVPADASVINEKIGDAIIYMLLIKGMLTEKEQNVEQVRIKYELTRD